MTFYVIHQLRAFLNATFRSLQSYSSVGDISTDTGRRAVPLRQLIFLLRKQSIRYVMLSCLRSVYGN